MIRLKIILFITLAFVLANCNTIAKEKKPAQKKNYKTITTFLQIDTLPKYKNSIEKLDSNGNTIQHVLYYKNTGLILRVRQFFYDSLQRNVLLNVISIGGNTNPHTLSFHYIYDSKGLISKEIIIRESDTITVVNEYYPDKRIKQSKTFTNTSATNNSWWNGIKKYIYNENDSLVKTESWDMDNKSLEDRDSIVYTDSSKIVFEFGFEDGISSKVETIYKNNKVVRQIKYEAYLMSDKNALYIEEETSFIYTDNRLSKKIVRTPAHTEWCGVGCQKRIETYTYLYE